VRVIFDDRYAMPSGNGDDSFHFAANACVVYEKNSLRPFGDSFFDPLSIDV
jgi:hypothetical protein